MSGPLFAGSGTIAAIFYALIGGWRAMAQLGDQPYFNLVTF